MHHHDAGTLKESHSKYGLPKIIPLLMHFHAQGFFNIMMCWWTYLFLQTPCYPLLFWLIHCDRHMVKVTWHDPYVLWSGEPAGHQLTRLSSTQDSTTRLWVQHESVRNLTNKAEFHLVKKISVLTPYAR